MGKTSRFLVEFQEQFETLKNDVVNKIPKGSYLFLHSKEDKEHFENNRGIKIDSSGMMHVNYGATQNIPQLFTPANVQREYAHFSSNADTYEDLNQVLDIMKDYLNTPLEKTKKSSPPVVDISSNKEVLQNYFNHHSG